MQIRLNFWQTLLLFLPGVVGLIIVNLPDPGFHSYTEHLAIANFLWVFNISIVITYQAYLALQFNTVSKVNSIFFKLNAFIPVVFTVTYLFYVSWVTFVNPAQHISHKNYGPMPVAHYNISAWISFLFLLHAFITFYFINNQFVSGKIRRMADNDEGEKLMAAFLIPMKGLTKISIYLAGTLTVIGFVIDIIRVSLSTK